eukprot:scaffold3231_cov275-Chaetoceros_neogracile.AAC.4
MSLQILSFHKLCQLSEVKVFSVLIIIINIFRACEQRAKTRDDTTTTTTNDDRPTKSNGYDL